MPSGLSEDDAVSTPKLSDLTKVTSSVVNYATATVSKVKDELGEFLVKRGIISSFTGITNADKLVTQNGMTVVKDATTNAISQVIGTAPEERAPASLFDMYDGSNRTIEQKVIISQNPATDVGLNQLTFEVMPTISERRNAAYDAFAPLHGSGEILKFRNSSARSWTISARLVSRTIEEATINLMYVNLIRSWVMPFVGNGTANEKYGISKYLGAPPPILTLSAYGEQMIGPVTCVLESYSFDWPNDVDYLQSVAWSPDGTQRKVPFPVVLSVSIDLKESWSPAEQSAFDLNKYKKGDMSGAYKPVATASPAVVTPTASTDTSIAVRQEPQSVSQSDISKEAVVSYGGNIAKGSFDGGKYVGAATTQSGAKAAAQAAGAGAQQAILDAKNFAAKYNLK